MRTRHLSPGRRPAATPLLLLVLLLLPALAACSSGSDGDAGGTTESAATTAEEPAAAAGGDGAFEISDEGAAPGRDVREESVISTGEVDLAAEDVAGARAEVERVVDRLSGEITDERTESDERARMTSTRLVVRVPSEHFAEAMDALSEAATLRSATSKQEDVTTQVIDTRVRIRAQEKSLRRVEQLLSRATSIRDIMAIEAQLTRRQADLDSLKSQQAWLADRTAQGTIAVRITRVEDEQAVASVEGGTGFLAGLSGGWTALTSVAVGLMTVAGAMLPFAAVLVLVGYPGLLVARRVSAGRSARTRSAA